MSDELSKLEFDHSISPVYGEYGLYGFFLIYEG